MRCEIRHYIFIAFLLLMSNNICHSSGKTAGEILVTPIGARRIAMGDACVGPADEGEIICNPAALSKIAQRNLMATGIKGLIDTYYAQFSYSQPYKEIGGIGASLLIFYGGEIEINYPDKSSDKVIAQKDVLFSFSFGREIVKNFSTGINLDILSSKLVQEVVGFAFCGDIGFLWEYNELSLGFSCQNIGPEMKYKGGKATGNESDPLPLTLRMGAGYGFKVRTENAINVGFDILLLPYDIGDDINIKFFEEGDIKIHIGAEYVQSKIFAARLGYKFGYDIGAFSSGFGLKVKKYHFDYGLSFYGDLGISHQLSLGMKL